MPVPRAVEPPRVECASVVPAFVVKAVDEPVLVSDALLVDPPDALVVDPRVVEGLVGAQGDAELSSTDGDDGGGPNAVVASRRLVVRERSLVVMRRLTR